jgi:hypothetical protein
MKTLGRTITNLLAVLILGSTLVLFISLPISYNNPKSIIELIDNED